MHMFGPSPFPSPPEGSMLVSLPSVQTQGVFLGPSGDSEGALCVPLEGIVSLSQLSDQVAAANGHRIKATSPGGPHWARFMTGSFHRGDSNALPGERQVLSLAALYNATRTT